MIAENLVADAGAIDDIAAAIKSGKTDPVALVEASLRRIAAVEREVQGWCLIDRERALAHAQILRQEAQSGRIRSPLHGLPVAMKDVLDVAGLPTRAGSKTRAQMPPSTIDAHVVTLLKAAGAIVLGKAHTTEFAYFDGPPPTRNPHNVAHTPGGSSAGPAAVVAAGMVPLSLGTQTGMDFFTVLGAVLVVALVGFWLAVATQTFIGAYTGHLFASPCLSGAAKLSKETGLPTATASEY